MKYYPAGKTNEIQIYNVEPKKQVTAKYIQYEFNIYSSKEGKLNHDLQHMKQLERVSWRHKPKISGCGDQGGKPCREGNK